MMEKVTRLVAIKRFIELDAKPTTMQELKDFKAACTDEEFNLYARQAAGVLGIEILN